MRDPEEMTTPELALLFLRNRNPDVFKDFIQKEENYEKYDAVAEFLYGYNLDFDRLLDDPSHYEEKKKTCWSVMERLKNMLYGKEKPDISEQSVTQKPDTTGDTHTDDTEAGDGDTADDEHDVTESEDTNTPQDTPPQPSGNSVDLGDLNTGDNTIGGPYDRMITPDDVLSTGKNAAVDDEEEGDTDTAESPASGEDTPADKAESGEEQEDDTSSRETPAHNPFDVDGYNYDDDYEEEEDEALYDYDPADTYDENDPDIINNEDLISRYTHSYDDGDGVSAQEKQQQEQHKKDIEEKEKAYNKDTKALTDYGKDGYDEDAIFDEDEKNLEEEKEYAATDDEDEENSPEGNDGDDDNVDDAEDDVKDEENENDAEEDDEDKDDTPVNTDEFYTKNGIDEPLKVEHRHLRTPHPAPPLPDTNLPRFDTPNGTVQVPIDREVASDIIKLAFTATYPERKDANGNPVTIKDFSEKITQRRIINAACACISGTDIEFDDTTNTLVDNMRTHINNHNFLEKKTVEIASAFDATLNILSTMESNTSAIRENLDVINWILGFISGRYEGTVPRAAAFVKENNGFPDAIVRYTTALTKISKKTIQRQRRRKGSTYNLR